MTVPARCDPGDAWAEWYARRGVWWADPEDMTAERLLAWGREQWLDDIIRAARLRPGDGVRVLEAGCGTGQYGLALALQGYDVDALDYNAAALEHAARLADRVTSAGRRPTLLHGDLMGLPTAPGTYDLVFNQQVLEYFVDDDQRLTALHEMVRTAKPGGAVVVVVARPAHPFARAWRRLGWPGFTAQPDMVDLPPRSLEDVLRAVGLTDVASDGIAAWRALFLWPRWYDRWAATRRGVAVLIRWLELVPLPRAVRRRFGLQLLVVGTKPDGRAPEVDVSDRTGP